MSWLGRLCVLGFVLTCGACGRREPRSDEPVVVAGDDAAAAPRCVRLPFAEEVSVAEASGSTLLTLEGRLLLLVVGDSGNSGAYVLVDAATGERVERGQLPLGRGAGDDLEGISADGDDLLGVTSAGWMRRWRRVDDGFALVDGPYPVGPVDDTLPLAPRAGGLGASDTDSVACGAMGVNCGKNYEGLCVAPGEPAGTCAGYLAARTDGRLWCLVRDGARLRVDTTRSIEVTGGNVLTGCDVAPDEDALWAGANPLGGNAVWRITGWRTPATAVVTEVGGFGDGFPESLAVGKDDVIYRLSDTGHGANHSLASLWRCFVP